MDLTLKFWLGIGNAGGMLKKFVENICALKMRALESKDDPINQLKEMQTQFVLLRNGLRRLELYSADHIRDFMWNLVDFFVLTSRWHDMETVLIDLRNAISSEKRDRHQALAKELEKFIETIRTHGRQKGVEGGLNQTAPGEEVTPNNVYLGRNKIGGNVHFDFSPRPVAFWRHEFSKIPRYGLSEPPQVFVIREQAETTIVNGAREILAPLERIIELLGKD